MLNPRLKTALESIDFQRQSPLFGDLTGIVGEMMQDGFSDKKTVKIHSERLTSVIFKQTGINTRINIYPDNSPNAFVLVPVIDRNHPLLEDFFRELLDNRIGVAAIRKAGGMIEGMVDKAKSRVSGGFSDFTVDTYLTAGLVNYFSKEEIAAVLLHELGHVFTYFEYIGYGIVTNFIIENVARNVLQTDDIKRRYEIVQEGSKALNIDIEDTEALCRSSNGQVIQTVILQKAMEKRFSQLGSRIHDMTAWESLCDQFATRHGAGPELVSALDKMFRMGGNISYRSTGKYLAFEALKMTFLAIGSVATLGILPFLVLVVADPNADLYDSSRARLARIRQDMVNILKKPDIDNNYRKQIVQDIEVIERVEEEMVDRKTFVQAFWIAVYPSARRQQSQVEFQQQIETLINNDLFVQSSRLKTLTT